MAGLVIWSAELDKRVKYKSQVFPDFDGYKFTVSLNKDIIKVLDKDDDGPRQQQAMVDDANDAMGRAVKDIESALKTVDSAFPKADRKARKVLVDACQKEVDKTVDELARTLEDVPEKRWKAWGKTKKDYKEYKIKTAVAVIGGTLGAVGSALSLAAAVPTGGATLALSIVGMVRSCTAISQTLVKIWAEAETVQKKLVVTADALKDLYEKKGKQALGAASTGATALNTILGLDALPSIKVLKGECELWEQKLNGIDVGAGKQAAIALKILGQADQLEKLLNSAKSKDAGKLLDKVRKARKQVNDHLEECNKQSARCAQGRKMQEIYADIVKELKSAQPKWSVVFDKAIPAAAALALAGANAGVGFSEAKDALDNAQGALDLFNEVGDTINELVDD